MIIINKCNHELIKKYVVLFLSGIFICVTFFNTSGISQILYKDRGHIPYKYQTDWNAAGLLPSTPTIANNFFDITQESGSSWDDKMTSALNKARNASGTSIIYLPALPGRAHYIFNKPIVLSESDNDGTVYGDNIIFQGDGANKTILEFDMRAENNCFDVRGGGYVSPTVNLISDFPKREYTFSVEDASAFKAGDWLHLEQPEFNYKQTTAWRASIGQITQIVNISGAIVTVRTEASKDYLTVTGKLPDQKTTVRKIRPIKNVGIENLKIIRLGGAHSVNPSLGNNVYFEFAVNCWIKGVEMERTAKNHIQVNRSAHIEVSGCFIHRSINYGLDAGQGYGIDLVHSTSHCLIENNTFRKLRHAMSVEAGANGNVFAFNYSREQYWTTIGDFKNPLQGADLVIHGSYAFSNLFEHNIVEKIEADVSYSQFPSGYHGINGPYNAFVRNAILKGNLDSNIDIEEITLRNAAHTGILGCFSSDINTSGSTSISVDLFGKVVEQGQSYEKGESQSHPNNMFELFPIIYNSDTWLADISYYYAEKPDFFDDKFNFPAIGPGEPFTHNYPPMGHIPASDRWYNSNLRFVHTTPTGILADSLGEDITVSGDVYITKDLTIPVGRTLTLQAGATVQFADSSLIYLEIRGNLLMGDGVTFVLQKNQQVIFAGTNLLDIPANTVFELPQSAELEMNIPIEMNTVQFTLDAGARLDFAGHGLVANSEFLIDPSATVRFKNGFSEFRIRDTQIRHYRGADSLLADMNKMQDPAKAQKYYPADADSARQELANNASNEFRLFQNYPNPFNPTTTIKFSLKKQEFVTLKIYNLLGEEVANLVEEPLTAGEYSYNWNAREVASGIYLYRIEAGDFVKTGKMILLR